MNRVCGYILNGEIACLMEVQEVWPVTTVLAWEALMVFIACAA